MWVWWFNCCLTETLSLTSQQVYLFAHALFRQWHSGCGGGYPCSTFHDGRQRTGLNCGHFAPSVFFCLPPGCWLGGRTQVAHVRRLIVYFSVFSFYEHFNPRLCIFLVLFILFFNKSINIQANQSAFCINQSSKAAKRMRISPYYLVPVPPHWNQLQFTINDPSTEICGMCKSRLPSLNDRTCAKIDTQSLQRGVLIRSGRNKASATTNLRLILFNASSPAK